MRQIRKRLLQITFGALVAVVLVKSLFVLLAEIPFHQFRSLQARVRDRGVELTDTQRAAQWERLEQSLRWESKNARAQFEMARTLHRLAGDPGRAAGICRLRNLSENQCEPAELLERAMDHYGRAIEQNRLIGGARFWKLAAAVRLDEIRRRQGIKDDAPMTSDEILDALKFAMQYEGQDPTLLKSAGDMAAEVGDESLAARYYAESLNQSLEALESIVGRVSLFKEGFDALQSVIPQTPEAYDRTSNALVDHWRFDLAESYWRQARAWRREPIPVDEPENLVANPRFLDPPGSHFLGWKLQKRAGVNLVCEPGQPGIRFELSGAPGHYFHFIQKIPVEPDVPYRFSCKLSLDGKDLRDRAAVGFEVIHPYDFSIWSAGARCVIENRDGRPGCRQREPDAMGNVTLEFDFTPPQPLRMIVLRLVWTNRPGTGRIFIDQVRIEKKTHTGENEHAGLSNGIHHHSDEE